MITLITFNRMPVTLLRHCLQKFLFIIVTLTFPYYDLAAERKAVNNAPIFNQGSYSFVTVDQNAIGSSVGMVAAADPDGDVVTYSIGTGNTNKAFAINSSTGAITIFKHLNYNTQAIYNLIIRATDNGGLFNETSVVVNVRAASVQSSFTSITWGSGASQPSGTHEVHGDVVNGKLYIFGGYDVQKRPAYTPTKRSFVYDPIANKWTAIADLPYTPNGSNFGGVTHEGLTTDGTDIYLAGGYTSNSNGTGQAFGTKQVWRYNVSSNAYTALPNLPIDLAAGQLRYLAGKLHFMGGANKSRRDTSVHYALDLDNLSTGWKVLAPLLNATNHAGSAVYAGKLYYLGGSHHQDDAAIAQKTVEVFDPAVNKWTLLADMPTARDHISSAVVTMGDRILVLGGETSHNVTSNLVSAFSPLTNSWANVTPLPQSHAAGIAAVLNGALYYTGGNWANTNRKGVPTEQKMQSFTLINADNGHSLQTINSSDTLNLAGLPTQNLNILANTNPATVGSVAFSLSGTQTINGTENEVPYALFGDDRNGKFNSWTPASGNYILNATPYSASKSTGVKGTNLTISFTVVNTAIQNTSLSPIADAFIRSGTYANTNYGNTLSLEVKGTAAGGYARTTYFKFSLSSLNNVSVAKLRIYGSNIDDNTDINVSVYPVAIDSWLENSLTWNNAPVASGGALNSASINNQQKYYEFDVTNYVKAQFSGDKVVSFLVKDATNAAKSMVINSKENKANRPQLLIGYTGAGISASALNSSLQLPDKSDNLAEIYPNPVHNIFYLKLPKTNEKNFKLVITDASGRAYTLQNADVKTTINGIAIDVSKLSLKTGVYFLKIHFESGKNQAIKFLVK